MSINKVSVVRRKSPGTLPVTWIETEGFHGRCDADDEREIIELLREGIHIMQKTALSPNEEFVQDGPTLLDVAGDAS